VERGALAGAVPQDLLDAAYGSAAEIVTFLQALRNELIPAVTVETSAW
jgi:hypothetical protein